MLLGKEHTKSLLHDINTCYVGAYARVGVPRQRCDELIPGWSLNFDRCRDTEFLNEALTRLASHLGTTFSQRTFCSLHDEFMHFSSSGRFQNWVRLIDQFPFAKKEFRYKCVESNVAEKKSFGTMRWDKGKRITWQNHKTLHSWWNRNKACPRGLIDDSVKHIFREHNREADILTNLETEGRERSQVKENKTLKNGRR